MNLADFTPTPENINALPEPIRSYIHELETRCDPAGDVAAIAFYREQVRQLQASNRLFRDAAAPMLHELDEAERDAWKNLARYKFWMFGYFAARWVYLNKITKAKRPNPFKRLVMLARAGGHA